MSKKQPYYNWDPETGTATCILYLDNMEFKGIAICHPDDKDFQSEKTGMTLAEMRAQLKVFTYYRDCVITPSLKALKQVYYSMSHSKQYNKHSYESRTLYRHIKMYETDYQETKKAIDELKLDTQNFIKDKDECYTAIRKLRHHVKKMADASAPKAENN